MTTTYMVVEAGGALLALDTASVQQVFTAEFCHAVPGAQLPVVGVSAWQGGALPLVDLASALALKGDHSPRATREDVRAGRRRVVVAEGASGRFGLVVERTHAVVELGLEPTSNEVLGAAPNGALIGEATWTGRMVSVIDAPALVEAEDG